jgi:hypothetical protein
VLSENHYERINLMAQSTSERHLYTTAKDYSEYLALLKTAEDYAAAGGGDIGLGLSPTEVRNIHHLCP